MDLLIKEPLHSFTDPDVAQLYKSPMRVSSLAEGIIQVGGVNPDVFSCTDRFLPLEIIV